MGTTADKLNKLIESKAAIKAAIEAKGVADVGDVLSDYPSKIASIPSGGTGGKFKVTNDFNFGQSTFTEFDPTQFDLSEKTDMSYMFYYCRELTGVTLDTSNVTDMSSMFYNCSVLTEVNLSDTSNVTTMNSMFRDISKLKSVSFADSKNVKYMNNMFYNCSGLTGVTLDTSNCTDMSSMFYNCSALTEFNLTDTSKVTSMNSMFKSCKLITGCTTLDTSSCTNMTYMFEGCSALTSVNFSNVSNVTSMNYIFSSCKALTTLSGFVGLKVNLDLSASEVLTVESVMNVINNAADMSSSAKTLTLNKTVFAQLSEEQIQTASAKGWNIAQK